MLRAGLDTGLWAFSSERSPTRPSPFDRQYDRTSPPCEMLSAGLSDTAHKRVSNPTVTLDALTLRHVSIHAAAARGI